MAVYSISQIQSLMRQVGWPANTIALGAAIFMAESSGRSDIIGTLANNEFSVGIAQINTRVHHNYTVEELKNPIINLREGLRIYQLQGWRAWGSYTDGRYRRYLAASNAALGSPVNALVPVPVTSPWVPASAAPLIQSVGAVAGATVQTVGAFFWQNWAVLLLAVGGLALLVMFL